MQGDESQSDLLRGTPYQAGRVLGRGAMGEVVSAEHRALGKPVVVKLIHTKFAGDRRLLDRFRVEAQALALIAHPNVVTVLDYGATQEGRPYLVMERLRGATLADELHARGAWPPAEAIEIVLQVLAGLEAVHAAGLVHRDIKLANVFLCDPDATGRRVVKLLDFGVAKVVQAPGAPKRREAPEYVTEEGAMIGTPRYAAPEQIRGERVDRRVDVYAAGTVLYALLTGRSPFAHVRGTLEVWHAHLLAAPALPSKLTSQALPAALDLVVLRALAKRPDDRYASAAAMAHALVEISAEVARANEARPGEATAPSHDESFASWFSRDADDGGVRATLSENLNAASVTPVRFSARDVCMFIAIAVATAIVVTIALMGAASCGGAR